MKIYFDIYSSDDKYLIENRKNELENKIFIFGSDNLNEKKKRLYKLNGKVKTVFNVVNVHLYVPMRL